MVLISVLLSLFLTWLTMSRIELMSLVVCGLTDSLLSNVLSVVILSSV